MNKNVNLIEGNILKNLTKLALPIVGTSFLQMAYNLTDIMWLGRLGTDAVAAAGTVGFFLWFGMGLVLISQIGVGVEVAQSYGRDDLDRARNFISNGFQLDIVIAILYSLVLYFFRHEIIGFFNLGDVVVIDMAIEYLIIISLGIIFFFLNPIFSTTLNSTGNSVMPFKINTIGLIANMILDPLFIFGLGPIPAMGIRGAGYATILAQFIVTLVFLIAGKSNNTLYSQVNLFKKPKREYIQRIVKLGFPAFLQTGIHSTIGMVLTRIISQFGPVPVAVQSIGSQIESLSWMSAEGFSTAISAFVGQNYGAKQYERIEEGYKAGMQIVGTIGLFVSILLIFAGGPLFKLFTPDDPAAIQEGIIYLRILGFSQFFMCIDIGTAGAFNGLGKTLPPAIVGIVCNTLRIPVAIILSTYTALGLSGIWWSMSGTSIIKGIVLFGWYNYVLKGFLREHLVQ